MKLSKSKLALAKVINESGVWADDSVYAANDEGGIICGYSSKPIRRKTTPYHWSGSERNTWIRGIKTPQWHQCVLSREEYYHAHPKADADGWIEWGGGDCPVDFNDKVDVTFRLSVGSARGEAGSVRWSHLGLDSDIIAYRLHKPEPKPDFCESVTRSIQEPKSKPTIEQLAQDYRNAKDYADRLQKEADDAKAAADVKFDEIDRLMESLGFSVIDVGFKSKSELLVNDWRDLKIGDYIRCIGDWQDEETHGLIFKVDDVEGKEYEGELAIRVTIDYGDFAWGKDFEFISRP